MRPFGRAEPTGHQAAPTARSRGRLPGLVAALAAIVAGAIALSGCGGSSAEGQVRTITIPEGAAKMMDRGEDVPQIPDRISGRVGDTLLIVNRDSSTQFVAGYPVSPHQTLEIPLNRAGW